MKFNVLGEVNVFVWDLVPDHDEATDGGVLVFKARADRDTQLFVSIMTNNAQLRLRCDSEWDTYDGVATVDEVSALAESYYRGC